MCFRCWTLCRAHEVDPHVAQRHRESGTSPGSSANPRKGPVHGARRWNSDACRAGWARARRSLPARKSKRSGQFRTNLAIYGPNRTKSDPSLNIFLGIENTLSEEVSPLAGIPHARICAGQPTRKLLCWGSSGEGGIVGRMSDSLSPVPWLAQASNAKGSRGLPVPRRGPIGVR